MRKNEAKRTKEWHKFAKTDREGGRKKNKENCMHEHEHSYLQEGSNTGISSTQQAHQSF